MSEGAQGRGGRDWPGTLRYLPEAKWTCCVRFKVNQRVCQPAIELTRRVDLQPHPHAVGKNRLSERFPPVPALGKPTDRTTRRRQGMFTRGLTLLLRLGCQLPVTIQISKLGSLEFQQSE